MRINDSFNADDEDIISHEGMAENFREKCQYKPSLSICEEEKSLHVFNQKAQADFLIETFRGKECLEIKKSKHDAKYRIEGQILTYKRAGYYASVLMHVHCFKKMKKYIIQICKIHNCSLYVMGYIGEIERVVTGSTVNNRAEVASFIKPERLGWETEIVDRLDTS